MCPRSESSGWLERLIFAGFVFVFCDAPLADPPRKATQLLADLEAAGGTDGRGGGDASKQIAVLQRLVQSACQCPADIETHVSDILKVTYFQTGVKALRTLSYVLLAQCRQGLPEADWDNVVGSSMKDIEQTADAELQCAALKALAFVPVGKMLAHLERARINLPGALQSPHPAVRRQACATMAILLLEKFTPKQVQHFASLWVAPLTRLLWSEPDPAVVAAAGLFLNQLSPGPLREAFLAEFAAVPTALFLVSDRVRMLMPDASCAPLLHPLAVVAAQSPTISEWFAGTVLLPRLSEPAPRLVMIEAARALKLLGDAKYALQANSVLLVTAPRFAEWRLPLPLDSAVRAASSFPRTATRVHCLSRVLEAHMERGSGDVAPLLAAAADPQAGELLLAAVVAGRRLRSLPALQACAVSAAGGWPKVCLRAALVDLGGAVPPELAALPSVPLTDDGHHLPLAFAIALGAGEAPELEVVNALAVAPWVRVSADSSPIEIECRHALGSENMLLAVRMTNVSGTRLPNVRLCIGVPAGIVPVSGAVQHLAPDLAPQQSVAFSSNLPLKLPAVAPLSFKLSFVMFPTSVAPASSSALVGRSFSCAPYVASIAATRRPLRSFSPADFAQFWNVFVFSCVETVQAPSLPDVAGLSHVHCSFVSADATTVRAQLATVTACDMVLLILFQAEKRNKTWLVRMTARSHCGEALLEMQSNGGAAAVVALKGARTV